MDIDAGKLTVGKPEFQLNSKAVYPDSVPNEVTLYAPNGKPIDRGKAEKSLQRSLSFPSLSEWQEAVIGGLSPADLASIYQDAAEKGGDPSRFLTFAEE